MAKTSTFRWINLVLICLFVVSFSFLGFAEEGAPASKPAETKNILNQQYLLGDWGGARTKLAEQKGISFDVFLQTDMLGAVAGGQNQGFGVWTRVRPTMDIDMGKLAHIKGMSLHITSTWNNGTDVARYLGALGNATGNDTGLHQFRLDSFWVKQDLFNGKLSLYGGQISGFDFFGFTPQDFGHFTMLGPFYAPLTLLNSWSSWDPNTTPAAMVQITPNKHFYYRTMIQSITHDNLTRNESGTSLEVRDGAVWNNEVGFLHGQTSKTGAKSYPGEVQFGVSYSGAKAYTNFKTGVEAFQPNSDAGYSNFYWKAKQAVVRMTPGSNRGIDLGAMFVYGPEDKGVLAFNKQFIATAEFNGLIASRPKDSLNFAFMFTGMREFADRGITNASLGLTSEKAYEFNYAFQATPYFQIMPVVQIFQDLGAAKANGNGVIMGVRTRIHF